MIFATHLSSILRVSEFGKIFVSSVFRKNKTHKANTSFFKSWTSTVFTSKEFLLCKHLMKKKNCLWRIRLVKHLDPVTHTPTHIYSWMSSDRHVGKSLSVALDRRAGLSWKMLLVLVSIEKTDGQHSVRRLSLLITSHNRSDPQQYAEPSCTLCLEEGHRNKSDTSPEVQPGSLL